ncbi:galactokinase [Phlyctochytrium bullatum]|nr:galactokinase [Phlyctochytrium bullatum]
MSKGLSPDIKVQTKLLEKELAVGNVGFAASIVSDIKKDRTLDSAIYLTLVTGCLRPPIYDRLLAESIYIEMVMKGRNVEVLGKRHELGSGWLKELHRNLGTKILAAHAEQGDLNAVTGLLRFMRKHKVETDVKTYTAVMSACNRAKKPEMTRQVYKEMCGKGHTPDMKTLHTLLTSMVKTSAIKEAVETCWNLFTLEKSPELVRHCLNVFLLASPSFQLEKRMFILKCVLEELEALQGKPDGFTYSNIANMLAGTRFSKLIMPMFRRAVEDASSYDVKDGPYPLSNALYTQVLRHLRSERSSSKEDFLYVLRVIRNHVGQVPPDGVTIAALLRGLRHRAAFKEALECYWWLRKGPSGLLIYHHPKCDIALPINKALHVFLNSCLGQYIRDLSALGALNATYPSRTEAIRALKKIWSSAVLDEMAYLFRQGIRISPSNLYLAQILLVSRWGLKRRVLIDRITDSLKDLVDGLARTGRGRHLLSRLKVTPDYLQSLLFLPRDLNKDTKHSVNVQALKPSVVRLEETLRALADLEPDFVDANTWGVLASLKEDGHAWMQTHVLHQLAERRKAPQQPTMSEEFPPTYSKLEDVYAPEVLPIARARYQGLLEKFKAKFDQEPLFFARSPGRVNIIGEHIDYCGFSVLPMAIARDVIVAVAEAKDTSNPPKVTVTNVNGEKYKDNVFEHNANIVDIDSTVLEWSNYFKCGYKGAFEAVAGGQRSLNIMIDGNVPAGAGVSSSSAFVCASALATLTASGKEIKKGDLAQTAIRSERYCGVQSGGMDQSISIMGKTGSALLIHFVPKLAVEPIKFPPSNPGLVFVIANTLVTADKHTTAPTNYNLRVVECRIVAAILSKHLGLDHCATLREVQDKWIERETAGGKVFGAGSSSREAEVLEVLETTVNAAFKDEMYTREEAAGALGLTVAELEAKYVGSIVIRADGFKLKKRARHVLSEARRVFQFRDVCNMKAPYSGNLLKDLGDLMNASQASCRDDFNCSCPELDELTALCRASGAFGSRLTGAGWGGCTVSLVAEPDVNSFIEKVTEGYYYKRVPGLKEDPAKATKISDWIFASRASTGAAVLKNLVL